MTTATTTLTLTDPRAIRAIAHEARQQLIAMLYSGEVLTSTQASTLIGLTPSATSYHMNALRRWGIAVQDSPSKDARERPWRAAYDDLRIAPAADIGGVARELGASMFLGGLHATLDAWAARPEVAGAGLVRGRVCLSDDEARKLDAEVGDAIRRISANRTVTDHPDGATARDYAWALVPAKTTS